MPCNITNLTFGTEEWVDNNDYECKVIVKNGKVSYGTAQTPSGMPADEIYFELAFDDDDYGFTYIIKGYRYTGFDADGIY